MNIEKLKKLEEQVRIGGKGTARRKKKIVHVSSAAEDKRLQATLKKISVNPIPDISEVNIINKDFTVIHFGNPRAQAALSANTFAISGHAERKNIAEMMPGILTHLGPKDAERFKKFGDDSAAKVGNQAGGTDDDFSDLVQDFEELALREAPPAKSTGAKPKIKSKAKPKNKK